MIVEVPKKCGIKDHMKSLNREVSNKATQHTFDQLIKYISANLWVSLCFESPIDYDNINGMILDQLLLYVENVNEQQA